MKNEGQENMPNLPEKGKQAGKTAGATKLEKRNV